MRLLLILFLILGFSYKSASADVYVKAIRTLYIHESPDEKSKIVDSVYEHGNFYIVGYTKGFWYGTHFFSMGYIKENYANYIPDGESQKDMDYYKQYNRFDTATANPKLRSIMTQLANDINNYLTQSKKVKAQGLEVNAYDWNYQNEYSKFMDFSVSVTNHSKKAIKYIYFYVAAYNPVNDVISYHGQSTFKLTGVGPIEPSEASSFNFENVLYSNVIDEVKLKKIEVKYMDNTIKTYSNIKSLMIEL